MKPNTKKFKSIAHAKRHRKKSIKDLKQGYADRPNKDKQVQRVRGQYTLWTGLSAGDHKVIKKSVSKSKKRIQHDIPDLFSSPYT